MKLYYVEFNDFGVRYVLADSFDDAAATVAAQYSDDPTTPTTIKTVKCLGNVLAAPKKATADA